MPNKLLLIGGGGHCRSVLDSILLSNLFDEVAIIDHNDCSIAGINTIGNDDDLSELYKDGWKNAFITVGSVGNTNLRRALYLKVLKIGFNVPSIVDPTAIVSKEASINNGVFVGKRVVINSGALISEGAIINTGSIIEHDCLIGSFSHISPGAVLCGQVCVGNDSHIGAGSVVRQLIKIGEHTLIGAGSVVVKDIGDYVKAYGNPCKVVD